jgi:hypothetical protein
MRVETKGLELLSNRPSVGSLSETDEFSSDELHRFWLNSRNIEESPITGSEEFPGEMLKPVSENITLSDPMLDLMVRYYTATYESLEFRKPGGQGPISAITIRIKIAGRSCKHYLAYIRWYRHADSENVRYHFSVDETCNVELWRSDFYPESRDCIIPVHHILGRFVPAKYKISTRRNAVEYLAVNPINRKFFI